MDRVRIDSAALLAEAGWLRSLAWHLVQDPEGADDLVQDTWRRALERPAVTRAAMVDPKGARFWLARVMRNLAKNRRRDSDVRAWHEKQASRSEAWTEDRSEDRVRLQRRLADAVLELPEPNRSAIVLRYFDELSTQEVAERLGVSHDAARQRISRGLAGLRSKLDREYGEERAAWCLLLGRVLDRSGARIGTQVGGGVLVAVKSKLLLAGIAAVVLASLGAWRFLGASRNDRPIDVAAAAPPTLEPVVDPTPASGPSRSTAGSAAPGSSTAESSSNDRDRELHGEVVDPAGRPISGARVTVLHNEAAAYNFLDVDRPYDQRQVAELGTDASGRFAVSLELGRPYLVEVTSRGFAVERMGNRYAGENVLVRMHVGATLRGRVRAQLDDAPIAGARVRVWPGSARRLWARVRLDGTTDDAGRFSFDDLAPDEYTVEAVPRTGSIPHWQFPKIEEGSTVDLDFIVRDGPTIRGRVTDGTTGLPIPGAEVGDGWTLRRTVKTNAQGEYEYKGLAVDDTPDLNVRAKGFGRKEALVQEGAGQALRDRVDFELLPARTARGRIVDEAGHPIPDAYVAATAHSGAGSKEQMDWAAATTDADGVFVLSDLRPDMPHTLVATKEGFGTVVLAFPAAEKKESSLDLQEVVLPSPSDVDGIVVDEKGNGIPDLTVSLNGWNDDRYRFLPERQGRRQDSELVDFYVGLRRARTDDQGRFRFTDLSPGSYRASTRMGGASGGPSATVVVPRAQVVRGVRLVLLGTDSLSGSVLDPDGNPVVWALVSARGEGEASGSSASASTDAKGRFTLEGLRKGTFLVRAQTTTGSFEADHDPTTIPAPVQIASIPTGSENLELRLRRPAVIDGDVIDESGRPVSDVSVFAALDGGFLASAKTDANGHFRITVGENDVVELRAQGPRKLEEIFESEVRVPSVVPGRGSVVIRLAHVR